MGHTHNQTSAMRTFFALCFVAVAAAFTAPATNLARHRSAVAPRTSVKALAVGDDFPAEALSEWNIKGKKAVVYFYGGDGAPSCTKQASAFASDIEQFKGVSVVGVRSDKQVKDGFEEQYPQTFVV